MKALKSSIVLKGASTVAIALVLLVSSCKKDTELLNASDTQNLNSEAVSDSYADEANDMATIATSNIDDSQFSGGRADGRTEGNGLVTPKIAWNLLDDRLKCATITIVRTNALGATPAGTITIDFGTGTCEDGRTIKRKGKIVVEYAGLRFATGSTIKTTFVDYFRNGVKVEGVHTLTNVTPSNQAYPRFSITIVGGKLTFADGKTVTREQSFIREWQRATNPLEDKWVILAGSSASGTNKAGKSYTMNVTKDLVYSRSCQVSNRVFIAVSGTKVFVTDSRTYTVDYGNGDCDNDITVSLNGVSKTITVNADGN